MNSNHDDGPVAQLDAPRPEPGSVEPTAPTIDERVAAGKACRKDAPRAVHAEWTPASDRADPVALLEESNRSRLQDLVPIRYGRMLLSPFTFLRGSPVVMAHDLSATPTSGIRVQACGDAQLMNFGLYASPERNLLFDVNDFDETLPAPWEWDMKRLATSFVVAARTHNMRDRDGRDAAEACARSYRKRMREYSQMRCSTSGIRASIPKRRWRCCGRPSGRPGLARWTKPGSTRVCMPCPNWRPSKMVGCGSSTIHR